MSQYFAKSYVRSAGNITVELDLPNHETKSDMKGPQALIHLRWYERQIWLA